MDFLRWLFEAQIPVAGSSLLLREVLGNIFGLLSALGGMRRKVWAWPVGIIGNLLLLTVFLGSLFGSASTANLLGQAGRQIMFIAVAVYGWNRWRAARNGTGSAITPQWAGAKARVGLVAALLLGTVALTPVFAALGSYEPVWADAWTFVGSLLATYGMARGWVEFWLIWVAVDIVGVPLLFSAGYYASAFMYLFYGGFTLVGFFVWWRANALAKPEVQTLHPDPRIGQPAQAGGGDEPVRVP
ncbi:nicotinamide riboside transporter PnuC [Arthrobacter sulfonylureivorans]|uniref:Nicotinamide riboside transporter PnuC n=1 Tax=Arthrobacter sulfonylureivorans TaxID=2486855 RepID=A0ABY3W3B7_9MICC|nr:nicotinamide riboside transporter PnuC [Arthrobacter sulfonylureivorans]UNK44595.1 nicotinamide riboside transporter PnuC [Arthrobacter sulfonylureivorans]